MNRKLIVANLKNSLPEDVDYRRVEFVGPKVGKELTNYGIKGYLIFFDSYVYLYLV